MHARTHSQLNKLPTTHGRQHAQSRVVRHKNPYIPYPIFIQCEGHKDRVQSGPRH